MVYTKITKTDLYMVKGKINGIQNKVWENKHFTEQQIIDIAKKNKMFYVVCIPDNTIKVVNVEYYKTNYDGIIKVTRQETIYIFSA